MTWAAKKHNGIKKAPVMPKMTTWNITKEKQLEQKCLNLSAYEREVLGKNMLGGTRYEVAYGKSYYFYVSTVINLNGQSF